MADYIRRDIVLKIINTVNDTGGFAGYADYCVLFDEIDTMPASDVQPVKHGRWICEFYNDVFDVYQADCSACKKESANKYAKVSESYEYCPNCGAKMDLKEGDTE